MKESESDKKFASLIRRATVKPGFRPETDEEIDAMLKGLGHIEITEDKVERVLRKVNGVCPLEECNSENPLEFVDPIESSSELAEMFKNECEEEYSQEVKDMLAEYEEEARNPDADNDVEDDEQ